MQIPQDLTAIPRWILWKQEIREGKVTKVPCDGGGHPASVTDPAKWLSYEDAVHQCEQAGLSGIGFCFTADDDIVGIDLDECLPIAFDAREILDRFAGTYAEVSPSGKGIKIFCRATKPDGSKNRTTEVVGFKQIEVYDRDRFFTVTGDQYGFGRECAPMQDAFDWLCDKFLAPPTPDRSLGVAPALVEGSSLLQRAAGFEGTNAEVVLMVCGDPKYARLWHGDISDYADDASAADAALAEKVAWLVGPIPERIEQILDSAPLMARDKWTDRPDYRKRTIDFALQGKSSFYSGGSSKRDDSATPPQATSGILADVHDIEARRVNWFLQDYVPKGMTMMLASPGGVAKGLYTLFLAANYISGPVIYCGAEDNLAMIVKPRAVAAGIPKGRFFPLREVGTESGVNVPIRFPVHAPILEQTVQGMGAKMVVIDAGPEHMEAGLKANSIEDVRAFMSPLNRIAEENDITILLILHTNKTHAAAGTDRVSGNRAWVDAQRHVLLAAIDDEDEDVRHFQVKKTNIAKQGIARQFRILTKPVPVFDRDTGDWVDDETPYLVDEGESEKDVDKLLDEREKKTSEGSLDNAILRKLSTGMKHPSDELDKYLAEAEGFSPQTVKNHRKQLKRKGLIDNAAVPGENGVIDHWVVFITPKGRAHLEGLGGDPGDDWRSEIDWKT